MSCQYAYSIHYTFINNYALKTISNTHKCQTTLCSSWLVYAVSHITPTAMEKQQTSSYPFIRKKRRTEAGIYIGGLRRCYVPPPWSVKAEWQLLFFTRKQEPCLTPPPPRDRNASHYYRSAARYCQCCTTGCGNLTLPFKRECVFTPTTSRTSWSKPCHARSFPPCLLSIYFEL